MMTPIYLNPPTSNSDQVKEDHDHHQHLKLFITQHQTSESSCSTFFNTTQDQNPSHDHHHSHQHEHKVYNYFWRDESSDRQVLPSSSIHPTIGDDSFGGLKSSSISKPENGGDDNNNNNTGNGLTVKWTSSKMRLMRKMMNSNRAATEKEVRVDHHHQQQQQQQPSSTQINYLENGNDIIRVCSNCNTTKTPLWRGGPCGPKSLCNACGIRLRKARRAMEAAATNGTVIETMTESSSSSTTTKTNHKVINKEKKSRTNYNLAQYKKQCKLQDQECVFNNDHQSTNKRLCFEDFALNLLNKNSGFRGVFAQDEEEGAVLLMALSCGLV